MLLHRNHEVYSYIAESLQRFPDRPQSAGNVPGQRIFCDRFPSLFWGVTELLMVQIMRHGEAAMTDAYQNRMAKLCPDFNLAAWSRREPLRNLRKPTIAEVEAPEQKPGPMAASSPIMAGSGRRCFITSSSTTSTEAEEISYLTQAIPRRHLISGLSIVQPECCGARPRAPSRSSGV